MIDQQTAETGTAIGAKTALIAQYGGSASAAIFGLTATEWQVVGVIGGLVIATVGFFVSWFYKAQHLKVAREKAFEWTPLSDE
jgi:hypothetical protein